MVLNFYAPWCPWCQRLEPTWEAVTQEVHKRYPESDGRIRFGKVRSTGTGSGPIQSRQAFAPGTCIVRRSNSLVHWNTGFAIDVLSNM